MRRDGSQVWHVSADETGLSLSQMLQLRLNDSATESASELIRQQRVQVDGNLCQDLRRQMRVGEVVKVLPHAVAARPTAEQIVIKYVDEHVFVIEKPSGLTTLRHADEKTWTGRRQRREATLDDLLPSVLAEQLALSRRPIVIPVHRLDRETSGLMVFARTAKAERGLVSQFAQHDIDRAYRAVVIGTIAVEETLESWFVRDRGDGKRGSSMEPDVGQRAVTQVRPIEQVGDVTLIECRLETGRTHQIRIHLSELKHPVCGDKEYHGPFGSRPIADRSGAPRLALHAAELGFQHPITGERLHFDSKLPRDLQAWLKQKRGNS